MTMDGLSLAKLALNRILETGEDETLCARVVVRVTSVIKSVEEILVFLATGEFMFS